MRISIPPWSDFFPHDALDIDADTVEFQSHLGLISFLTAPATHALSITDFNPTLVWFLSTRRWRRRRLTTSISIPPWSDFFPCRSRHDGVAEVPHFNPTLVWFLSCDRVNSTPCPQSFQSHLGLIYFYVLITAQSKSSQFQSHLGLISSTYRLWRPPCPRRISIPPWSDFFSTTHSS